MITRFGDKAINDSNDLVGAVQAGKVGDRVEVTYKRNGAEATATVTLAETSSSRRPPPPAAGGGAKGVGSVTRRRARRPVHRGR